ncbi:MAG: two-component regulator propeller domain-containing protein [Bacteroidota bacterium]|nr:two-component regulator propeller domain-containing protein [Bacteroidota bacterium]
MKSIKYCLLIAVLWGGFSAFSQQPYTWHLSDDDGLPSNEVYQIFQDKKGYIWFGTDNGVAKYDGRNFKVFTCEGQRGKALSFFNEDPKGRIWCVNFSGQILYIENDSLRVLTAWEKYNKLHFPNICIDQNNIVWIASQNNPIFSYNPSTK